MDETKTVILAGVNVNNQPDFDGLMSELANLAEACGMEVLGRFEQNLKEVNNLTYLGSGKVEELKEMCANMGTDAVVVNDELSPSQLFHLAKGLEVEIYDRTSLILEIFASRTKTKEAKLQVEVARLQYMLPRLKGTYESLGRQGGGAGLRNRGAGEKKLELNRRQIEAKIVDINKELKRIFQERQVQRRWRKKAQLPSVALVGYTNAGKSTVMNAILDVYRGEESKKVLEKDMLFATLETSIREITLPDKKRFLLSDTVGFVSNLPHNLVKAFRSTLEEAKEADLLLHVVDFSNPHYQQQIEITMETLKQIGADEIPVLYVYNKMDLTDIPRPLASKNIVCISAKNKDGIEQLTQAIREMVFDDYIFCTMRIPYQEGNLVSYFNDHSNVINLTYEKEGTVLDLECHMRDYEKYKQYVVKVIY